MVGSPPFPKMQPEMVNNQDNIKPQTRVVVEKNMNNTLYRGWEDVPNSKVLLIMLEALGYALAASSTNSKLFHPCVNLHVESAKNRSKRLVMSRSCEFRSVCPHT